MIINYYNTHRAVERGAMPGGLDSFLPEVPAATELPALAPTPVLVAQSTLFCASVCCTRTFTRAVDRERHYVAMPSHRPAPTDIEEARAVAGRKFYTWTYKRDTVLKLEQLQRDGVPAAQKALARTMKPNEAMLCKWSGKEREHIFAMAVKHGCARKHRTGKPNVGLFPLAEIMVFGRFLYRRQQQRLPVHRDWLQQEMLSVLARSNPGNAAPVLIDNFVASEGWASNFCRRFGISSQCRTNKHVLSITERLPEIREFHQFLMYDLQARLPSRCPIYGRFPAKYMFHLDQSPLPFVSTTKATLNVIGDQCSMGEPGGSGGTKRFCTLQICICASGPHQCVKLEIYFRGKGKRLTPDEWAHYEALADVITVRFQHKAWSDGEIALETLIDFRAQTLHLGEVLLGMDGHKAQINAMCRAFMDLMGIRYAITPPNCTDCTSPVDRHVGAYLKKLIEKRFAAEWANNVKLWDLPKEDGGLRTKQKRMLVATWAAEAWLEMCTHNTYLIEQSFVQTGFFLPRDGSGNSSVRPWKAKTGAAEVGSDGAEHSHTNISPEGVAYDIGPPPAKRARH